MALDRLLVSKGWPPMSPWWEKALHNFYLTRKPFLVARVGRRGGKSSTLCRLAVAEALWGEHDIPPGDVGVVPFVSTRVEEAGERLQTIRKILTALGVKYTASGDSIRAQRQDKRDVMWRCFPATVAGVSGFTSVLAICDEVAKWKDRDTGANPATEVLRSLRPTLASQKNAKMVLSSSPLGLLDAHADAFAAGDTAEQMVVMAETWVANPTLSVERTKQLEPDEPTWRREYAAIPQAEAESSFLSEVLVDAAIRPSPLHVPRERGVEYYATMDPATRGHAWTFTIGGIRPNMKRAVVYHREWQGTRDNPLSPKEVLRAQKSICTEYGVDMIWTDQLAIDAMRDLADDIELTLVEVPWTLGRKIEAFESLRAELAAKTVELPDDPVVKTDLLQVKKRLTRSGISLEIPEIGGRHCDYAPAVAMLLHLPMAPPNLDHTNELRGEARAKEERRKNLEQAMEKVTKMRFGRRKPSFLPR